MLVRMNWQETKGTELIILSVRTILEQYAHTNQGAWDLEGHDLGSLFYLAERVFILWNIVADSYPQSGKDVWKLSYGYFSVKPDAWGE